jgi:hypothetical protein
MCVAERQWLTLVIPATQEAESRRITVLSQPRQIVYETLSQKDPSLSLSHTHTHTHNWLVEWLKVYTLSSSPSTTHTEKSVCFCKKIVQA